MKTGFERAERTASLRGWLPLAVLLSSIALGQAQVPAKPEPATICPFKVHLPDQVLIDLRRRLAETKWPDQIPGTTWLAWMISKFQLLTDNHGDFLTAVDRDTFLTDVTLYWATGTVGSSMRIYRENRLTREEMTPTPRLETPVADADFPREVAVPRFAGLLRHTT